MRLSAQRHDTPVFVNQLRLIVRFRMLQNGQIQCKEMKKKHLLVQRISGRMVRHVRCEIFAKVDKTEKRETAQATDALERFDAKTCTSFSTLIAY